MPPIELYYLPGCPYCRKVERKLDELDVAYERTRVPVRHSKRETVEELSGQTAVPVIVDRDHGVEGMAESDDIIAYLEETYGG
ncbi:MAG: glutaredoxin family protein [Halodesulfurarchaeum sp.]